jgi:hypothetical protein
MPVVFPASTREELPHTPIIASSPTNEIGTVRENTAALVLLRIVILDPQEATNLLAVEQGPVAPLAEEV